MKRLYVINEAAGWENYGDSSYLLHGGVFVRQYDANTFQIVKNVAEDFPETYEFLDLQVDISDSWIELESVQKYADVGCNGEEYINVYTAIACTEYYSASNFGSDIQEFLTDREVEQRLIDMGVLIPKYPTRKRRRTA